MVGILANSWFRMARRLDVRRSRRIELKIMPGAEDTSGNMLSAYVRLA